ATSPTGTNHDGRRRDDVSRVSDQDEGDEMMWRTLLSVPQQHSCRCTASFSPTPRRRHECRRGTLRACATLLALVHIAFAQTPDIKTLPVRGNIYMLSGAGANITVSAGPDGILLVDTGTAQMTAKVLAALNDLAKTINTSGLPNKNVPPTKPI